MYLPDFADTYNQPSQSNFGPTVFINPHASPDDWYHRSANLPLGETVTLTACLDRNGNPGIQLADLQTFIPDPKLVRLLGSL
jgi:hypothetical protein